MSDILNSDEDFPTIGLTDFDLWMHKLYCHAIGLKFIEVTDYGCFDRQHFKTYYDDDYSFKEALDEEMSYYGD